MEMGDLKKKQAGTRRVWIMFGLIMFVPMTALSLRMYACDSWSPVSVTVKYNDAEDVVWNQWFYDNSVSCNETSLQAVNFLATMLLVGEFGVIVFLFLILFRLWRFDLKDKQSDLFGALYESYNDKGLFCEPILLLRKFILMMTTQVTYIPAAYSAGANSALSFAWLLFILIRQPYISSTDTGRMVAFLNNWCNLFEIAATILITLIQVYALADGIVDFATLTTVNMDGLSYTILVLSSLLVIVWVVMFIIVLIRVTRSGLKDLKRTSTANKNSRRETVVSNPAATARVSPSEFSDGDALEMAPIVDGDLEC